MYFPTLFSRMSAGSGLNLTVLGTDTPPANGTPPNASTMDNLHSSRFMSITGWPCHRIAVVCKYTGAGPAVPFNADLYMWEAHTQSWNKVNATAVAITPGTVAFFDVVGLLDMPNNQSNLQGYETGSISVVLVAADPGEPHGQFDLALASDLTTFSK